jgi:DNA-binding NarL/FixJ family response regulator
VTVVRGASGGEVAEATPPSIRLLIADDQKLAVDTIVGILEAESHIDVVGVAANGAEAVKLAETLSPDVVLMDVNMPLMDGYEATRRIRARDGAPSVLVLTAAEGDESVEKAREAGAAGFLKKDGSAVELVGLIVAIASLAG